VPTQDYDIVIIGGGPAGLTAGIYAARALRKTLMLERGVIGGQVATTDRIENYPGYPDGVNGFDLAQDMLRQAEQFGMETAYAEATELTRDGDQFLLQSSEGGDYRAKAVIVTAGANPNRLGVEGEERLTSKGVSYCATCDGAFFKDTDVIVVGGGDAALDEALFMTRYARSVEIVHRRDQLRASAILQERARAHPKISFTWDTVVEEILGEDAVESVRLRNVKTGETNERQVAAVFIFVGQAPNSSLLDGLVEMDEGLHARVNLRMETEVPGLYVAGDVRTEAARQLVTAAGDGATAAIAADHYISASFGKAALAEGAALQA
jgi:thioredoxin reductase (NADPH)